ncbi:MAG: filamentous hemagglutinin N-terminal domain-containing protein [Pseudomonadota bacterium]
MKIVPLQTKMHTRRCLCLSVVLLSTLSCLIVSTIPFTVSPVWADIVTDGSLGPAVEILGPDYTITADLGVQRGGNLFQSFSRFNIDTGEKALFSGPASISHVISRVTGGQASRIDGALACDIPGADFYFINPAGIVFGPNAALNVGASFFVSTADYVRLCDGGSFSASDSAHSSLTSAPPSAFGFMDSAPGNISIQGRLAVPEGNSLTVVGGDVGLSAGTVEVSGGVLSIAATASTGEMTLADLDATSFDKLGTISLSRDSVAVSRGVSKAAVFIRGDRFIMDHSTLGVVNDGNVAVGDVNIGLTGSLEMGDSGVLASAAYGEGKGGDIRVSAGSVVLSSGAQLYTHTAEAGDAGNISIQTDESVTISGKNEAGTISRLMSLSDGSGGSGNIDISTAALHLESEGRIINHHNNDGYRGTTSISAGSVVMDDNSILMCGNLDLEAGTIEISDGAYIWGRPSLYNPEAPPLLRINASESLYITGQGQAEEPWRNKTHPLYTGIHTDSFVFPKGVVGSIELSSPLIVVNESGQISTRTNTSDPGGNIVIDTDKLMLWEGGQVAADSNGSSIFDGPAGNITINASESVDISGSNGKVWSGLLSTSRSRGDAGQIEVITPLLTIGDEGIIHVGLSRFSEGNAGKILLKTDRLQILPGGEITTFSEGHGGEGQIEILSKDSIFIRYGLIATSGDIHGAAGDIILKTPSLNLVGGIISAGMLEEGGQKGGNIVISADKMTLESNSEISAFSLGSGDAGSILFDTGTAYLSDSAITTQTVSSDGGDIYFKNEAMTLLNMVNSKITTTVAGGQGDGGNITIERPIFVVLENGEIIANAFEGAGGNIQINTQQLIQDPDSRIEASSRKGIDGRIDISSPDTDISGSITVLPDTFLDAAAFMKNPCDAKTMGNTSSLVSTGFAVVNNAPEDAFLSDFFDSNKSVEKKER